MPRAYYDPYGIFPSPKPHRRIRRQQHNRFNRIGGEDGSLIHCRAMDFLWNVDNSITEYFAAMANESNGSTFRTIAKIMELSMHGIPWLLGITMGIFLTDNRVAAHLLINLLLGKGCSIIFLWAATSEKCKNWVDVRFYASQGFQNRITLLT